jgi:hypothetical protein
MVAHVYNTNYLGGRDREDCCLRPDQTKTLWDPISKNKLDVMACACGPSYAGGGGRRIMVWGWPWTKAWDCIWKITKAQQGWGHCSSGSVCLATARPWVQTSVLPMKKSRDKRTYTESRHSLSKVSNDFSSNNMAYKALHEPPLSCYLLPLPFIPLQSCWLPVCFLIRLDTCSSPPLHSHALTPSSRHSYTLLLHFIQIPSQSLLLRSLPNSSI